MSREWETGPAKGRKTIFTLGGRTFEAGAAATRCEDLLEQRGEQQALEAVERALHL